MTNDRREFLKKMAGTAGLAASGITLPAMSQIQEPGLQLVKQGDANYERYRIGAVWNQRKPERYPKGIVFPRSDQDVVDAVNHARSHGLRVTVKSGGHNWIGNHVQDGCLLLDLSRMRSIEIDQEAGIARVQPAVMARQLLSALTPLGYRFPTATCPTVAVGGHLIGGGASFTTRLDGASCYSVAAADVVLPSGELVHATDDSHPDIMWALRGGGPLFFGVVTRLHLTLHKLPGSMMTSAYSFPSTVSRELMDWHLSISDGLSNKVQHNWFGVKSLAPPGFSGIPVTLGVIAMGETEEESRALLDVFEKCPLLDKAIFRAPASPWSYDAGFSMVDHLYPKGYSYRSDALWIENPRADGFIDLVAEAVESLPNLHSHILWAPYYSGSHHANACSSFGDNPPPLSLHFYGVSRDPGDNAAMDAWVNGLMRKAQHYSLFGGSGKINDNNVIQFPKYIIPPANTDRLYALREQYDPEGVMESPVGGFRPRPLA